MPRATHPGPPPPAPVSGKPASYLEAQARASGRFQLRTDFTPQGDQAAGDRAARRRAQRGAPRPGAPRRHRLGQDVHDGQGRSRRSTARPSSSRTTRPSPPSSTRSSGASSRENAVEYFVSYYDYYQPEAYVPQTDTYIEKETTINDEIDKLRLRGHEGPLRAPRRHHRGLGLVHLRPRRARVATTACSRTSRSGTTRGMTGPPGAARRDAVRADQPRPRRAGRFRVRGDVLEVAPGLRGHGRPGRVLRRRDREDHPDRSAARHAAPARSTASRSIREVPYVTPRETLERAIGTIEVELDERLAELTKARASSSRRSGSTSARMFDLEMMKEIGYCSGIENYSRHLSGRAPGGAAADAPRLLPARLPARRRRVPPDACRRCAGCTTATGRASRSLVEYGFRLPSALDNRPLTFEEFGRASGQRHLRVARRPAPRSSSATGGEIVEQVIRPTGLLDPMIEVRPVKGQVDDLLAVVREARPPETSACSSRRSPSGWPRS